MIADTPEVFAERTIQLMSDHHLARQLTSRGHDLVHAHYDWRIIYTQVQQIYNCLKEAGTRETTVTPVAKSTPSLTTVMSHVSRGTERATAY
jgi:hypothetical protein